MDDTAGQASKKDGSIDKLEAQLAVLGKSAGMLRQSETWQAWLKFSAKFHRYSALNRILIFMANPEATHVAGYHAWRKDHSRQVVKGAKGIKIIRPLIKKNDEGRDEVFNFGWAHVFDIADTDGEPVPPRPEWPRVEGQAFAGFINELRPLARQFLNVDINMTTSAPEMIAGARGWFDRRTMEVFIVDDGTIPPDDQLATLLHELGHVADPEVATDENRARRELVAESTAAVLGEELGLDLTESAVHYLASWEGTDRELVLLSKRIGKATTLLMPLIENARDRWALRQEAAA